MKIKASYAIGGLVILLGLAATVFRFVEGHWPFFQLSGADPPIIIGDSSVDVFARHPFDDSAADSHHHQESGDTVISIQKYDNADHFIRTVCKPCTLPFSFNFYDQREQTISVQSYNSGAGTEIVTSYTSWDQWPLTANATGASGASGAAAYYDKRTVDAGAYLEDVGGGGKCGCKFYVCFNANDSHCQH